MVKKVIKLDKDIEISNNKHWVFDSNVVNSFDSHITKSVPSYLESHNLIVSVAKDFLSDNSKVLDIGCSTGSLLDKIKNNLSNKAELTGIDISKDMINYAKKVHKNKKIKFYCKDILKIKNKSYDLIISFYTLQFIHPNKKNSFIKKCYELLNQNGYLILFDKVTENSGFEQKIIQDAYNDFKKNNNFEEIEIYNKTETLRGVLHPYSREENYKLFRNFGFQNIFLVSKNLFFEGYLLKK